MTAAARAAVRKNGGPEGPGEGAGATKETEGSAPHPAPPAMKAPDGGWGWMVVLGVAIVNLATRSLEPSFGLLFGDLLSSLDVATTGAAVIVSAQDALINFSGLFAGPLIRRYSYRKVAFGGALMVAIGILATVPANSVGHIIATYSVLIGLGVGFSSAATFVSLSHYFQARRGQAVGLSMAGTAIGFMLAPLLVRLLLDELGFRGALLVLGGVALNGLAGAFLLQPAKWHLVPVTAAPALDGDPEEQAVDDQEEQPQLRESAVPLLARPRIELTLVEEDEEAYQLTIRAQQPERKVSTVSGLAFEVFTDPKRKFSVSAVPPDTSKVSLDDSEPHLYPCRKLSQPAGGIPRNASAVSMEDHPPRRMPSGRHGLPRNTSVVSMSVADGQSNGERKLSRNIHGIPRNVSWISMGYEETPSRKLSRTGMTRAVSTTRIRKASVISASSMDLTGSLLAIAAESQQDLYRSMQNNNTILGSRDNLNEKDMGNARNVSCWRRISNFLDLDLLKDSTYLNITLGLSLFWVAELHFKMVVPFFLRDMGHSKSAAALCLSMSALSDVLARLILPPICDRVKYKKRTLFFCACIFLTISRSVLAEQTSWAPLMASLVICGFCRGATLINYQLTVAECVTLDKLPAAVGLNMVAKGITVVSLGPILGLIRDATGSFPIFIHAQSVLMTLGLLAWAVEYVYLWKKGSSTEENETQDS